MTASDDREQALALSRRLDWRFLLSDPSLETVAYIGDGGGRLLEALRVFATVVDVLTPPEIDTPPSRGRYDLVVIQGAAAIGARHRAMLQPNGSLYAEISRAGLRPAYKRAISAASYARDAEAAGFSDARLNWHWPAFETCTRIVPLDDETPLGFVLAGGQRDFTGALAFSGARLLVRSGVLARSAPCFSLIAQAAGT
jgi:hypothetical protein